MNEQKLDNMIANYEAGYNEFGQDHSNAIAIGEKLHAADAKIEQLQQQLKDARKSRAPISRADKKMREVLEVRVKNFGAMVYGARLGLEDPEELAYFDKTVGKEYPLVTVKDFGTFDFYGQSLIDAEKAKAEAKAESPEEQPGAETALDTASDSAADDNEADGTAEESEDENAGDAEIKEDQVEEDNSDDDASTDSADQPEATNNAEGTEFLTPEEIENGWYADDGTIYDAGQEIQRPYNPFVDLTTPQGKGYQLRNGQHFDMQGNVVDDFGVQVNGEDLDYQL